MLFAKRNKAFTLVEIMIVVALIALLSAISIVNLLASRKAVAANVCAKNRAAIEDAEASYFLYSKKHTQAISELVDLGYLSIVPDCPSGGVYAWVPYSKTDPSYQAIIGCSLHSSAQSKLSYGQIKKAINQKYHERYKIELAKIRGKYHALDDIIKKEKPSNWKQLINKNRSLRKAEEKAMKNENKALKKNELKQAQQNYKK